MRLELNQSLQQKLSPNMIQSMEILQMGINDLQDFIEDSVSENPVLELSETSKVANSDLGERIAWLESQNHSKSYTFSKTSDDEVSDPLEFYAQEKFETLTEHLSSQINFSKLSTIEAKIVATIITSLDDNGFLEETSEELAENLAVSLEFVEKALDFVKSLEPCGIASRDLVDCLNIQAKKLNYSDLCISIINNHLDDLASSQFNKISKQTGASRKEVETACADIKKLNPRPAASFKRGSEAAYISPDFTLNVTENGIELILNNQYIPSLNMSTYYIDLWKSTDDESVKTYLDERMRKAQWLMQNIEYRNSSVYNCCLCIVEHQKDFFYYGAGHLAPLSLRDVAEILEVHESTVSRTIKDKYLQCHYGVFPLSYFFQRGLDGETGSVSQDKIKTRIAKLIEDEDSKKPISDQKIAEILENEGIYIKRRTVAKYRESMNIKSTAGRRNYI